MASNLTLSEVDISDILPKAPAGKQIMFLNQANGVAYLRDDDGNDISMTAQNEFLGVTTVNQLSDLPDAVGGKIEIGAPDGEDIAYQVSATAINLGSSTLINSTGSNIRIYGMHGQKSAFTSDSTDPLIEIINGSLAIDLIVLSNPNGNFFSMSGDGSNFLNATQVIFFGCQYVAQDISGTTAVNFFRCAFLATSAGGITFDGPHNQLTFSDNAAGSFGGFAGYSGKLINLQDATFNSLQIVGANRIFMQDGTTFLDGAANGANINAGGFAEVKDAVVIQEAGATTGVSIATITGQDDRWLLDGNNLADGVRNTRTVGDAMLDATAVISSTQNVYAPTGGTDWSFDLDQHFDVGTNGEVEYTSVTQRDIFITAGSTVEKSGGGSEILCSKISIDYGAGFILQDKTISCTQNGQPTPVESKGLFTLNQGDKFRVEYANTGSNADIEVSVATMSFFSVGE